MGYKQCLTCVGMLCHHNLSPGGAFCLLLSAESEAVPRVAVGRVAAPVVIQSKFKDHYVSITPGCRWCMGCSTEHKGTLLQLSSLFATQANNALQHADQKFVPSIKMHCS